MRGIKENCVMLKWVLAFALPVTLTVSMWLGWKAAMYFGRDEVHLDFD